MELLSLYLEHIMLEAYFNGSNRSKTIGEAPLCSLRSADDIDGSVLLDEPELEIQDDIITRLETDSKEHACTY